MIFGGIAFIRINQPFLSQGYEPVTLTEDEIKRIPLKQLVSEKRLPKAIIIGSRKCGTRALLKFLELNTEIRAAPNEVHFFDRDQNYRLGLDWYRKQMLNSTEDQIAIEKSPSYFVEPLVTKRISNMNSSIKLVVIVRDPVKRAISDFSQIVSNKIENFAKRQNATLDGIEEAWHQGSRVFRDRIIKPDGTVNENSKIIRHGLYSTHLERWRKVFSDDQIHIVDGENFIKDPYSELQQVEQFLQLKPMIGRSDFVFDKKKGFYCIAIDKDGSSLTNDPIKTKCLSKHKGRRHIKVDQDLLRKLVEFYQPYNDYLFSLIGKQKHWSSRVNCKQGCEIDNDP